jgi:hypothetical protein
VLIVDIDSALRSSRRVVAGSIAGASELHAVSIFKVEGPAVNMIS